VAREGVEGRDDEWTEKRVEGRDGEWIEKEVEVEWR